LQLGIFHFCWSHIVLLLQRICFVIFKKWFFYDIGRVKLLLFLLALYNLSQKSFFLLFYALFKNVELSQLLFSLWLTWYYTGSHVFNHFKRLCSSLSINFNWIILIKCIIQVTSLSTTCGKHTGAKFLLLHKRSFYHL